MAPTSFSRLNLVINASYSTSLFVVLNPKRIAYLISNPSGVVSKSPAPLDEAVDDPSMWRVHSDSKGLLSSISTRVSSVRKSAKTFPFTDYLDL